MHFHGVHYAPSSDGAYVPGFSGGDTDVMPGHTWTYRLTAGPDSVGVWPYHDHSPSMEQSIDGGMFGMLSILGRHDRAPDREFEVVFSQFGNFMAIVHLGMTGEVDVRRVTLNPLSAGPVPTGQRVTFTGRTADGSAAVNVQEAASRGVPHRRLSHAGV